MSIGNAAICRTCEALLGYAKDAAAKNDWESVHRQWLQVHGLAWALQHEKSKAPRARLRVNETLKAIEGLRGEHVRNAG